MYIIAVDKHQQSKLMQAQMYFQARASAKTLPDTKEKKKKIANKIVHLHSIEIAKVPSLP